MTPRYYVALVEEQSQALAKRLRPRRKATMPPTSSGTDPMLALLEGLAAAARRSEGENSWAQPHAENPIGFVLDSMSDGIVVRTLGGDIVFRNRAAASMELPNHYGGEYEESGEYEEIEAGNYRWVCRRVRYRSGGETLTVEVISQK